MGPQSGSPATHVAIRDVVKRYPGVLALDRVTVDVRRATVHALVGENGAGKSTLGKIVAGAVVPDGGTINVGGEPVSFHSPRDALSSGIALVHQEISLVPGLSVVDNVFLGIEPGHAGFVDRQAQRRRLRGLCDETGFSLEADRPVRELRLGEQQKVEIIRALARGVELIVFDEPTAALTREEAEQLHGVIRTLRDRGTTVIYVSHFLEEVLAIADAVSVLKDGHLVRTAPAAQETVDSLITGMLGRSLEATFPPKRRVPPDAPVVLRANNVTRRGVIEDVSLTVRAGEIVGVAGLVGSGRTELARVLFGADPRSAGHVEVAGRAVRIRSPREAVEHGVALVPEDRKGQGLVLQGTVLENITMAGLNSFTRLGFIRTAPEAAAAGSIAEQVELRPPQLDRPVATLSGGNQQKVVFARWLSCRPAVLIADEPTRGVDVGAKRTLYELLQSLAEEGMGVLLISSELEELTGLAHRIVVMRQGRLVSELPGDADEAQLLSAAFGESHREVTA
ncbi:sugar ABC transporter ATP-binding protein (plasmid) [Streptomyces sp. NBC_01450]|uniref:sugar ABC transporter ATP-binding protein n=1 Tax=Streptomyces sp. NBC_01450 TaxID=2903871 RepID=UPI002E3607B5|nr:sugar ABC transporter ATP-binding protein [Streptomyces sp. NBC_01450]